MAISPYRHNAYRITGSALVFMLLIKYGFSEEDLILRIEEYNSTKVNVTCQYLGEVVDDMHINIYINHNMYLLYTNGSIIANPRCNFQAGFSEGMRIWFLLDPPMSCNESLTVRCNIKNGNVIHERETYLLISPKNDPPEILINSGQAFGVTDTDKPVHVNCLIRNMCNKEEIEIISNAGAYIGPLSVSVKELGERFKAEANTTALFYSKEQYFKITCRTKSRNISSYVHGDLNPTSVHDKLNEGEILEEKSEHYKVAFIAWVVMSIVTVAALVLYILKSRRREVQSTDIDNHAIIMTEA